MEKIINKSMDLEDFENDKLQLLISELIDLEEKFKNNNFNISSWYGNINGNKFYDKLDKLNRGYKYKNTMPLEYDKKYPSFLVWEIYSVINGVEFKPDDVVLDIGGACSLFSFYLESKGVKVVAIDKNEELVKEANSIAKKLNLNYTAVCADAEDYVNKTDIMFDKITSICVFEHIELNKRKRIINKLHNIFKEDGKIAITFDYRNPSKFVNINTPNDVKNQFDCSQHLRIYGNQEFYDNNKNYLLHPFFHRSFFIKYKIRSIKKGNFRKRDFFKIKFKNDYSFGVIFMEKK